MTQDARGQAPGETPHATMVEMVYGLVHTQTLYVAATLGIADLLADGPKSVEELAAATGTHPPSLRRVLRLLASNGVFAQVDDGRFALNARADVLRADAPGSLKAMAEYYGAPWNWAAWGHLVEAVRSGRTAFDLAHGRPLFAYLTDHPDDAAIFDRYMAAIPGRSPSAVVAAYDFSRKKLVVDVGGGLGGFLIAVLQANPLLHGLLFDLPEVVARAQDTLAAAGVADRCACVGGDLFEAVPPGGDVYFLSNILHDWDDDRATQILRNCRHAMAEGSLLLIRELVMPEGVEPAPAKRTDVVMLALTGGLQRTEAEFHSMLGMADFRLTRVVPLPAGGGLIEAVPA